MFTFLLVFSHFVLVKLLFVTDIWILHSCI